MKLYLLDSNDAANFPAHRGITSELYGGGPELRLEQELLLGIGGWRLLNALGIQPEVCHLNEGHAAFAVLERAKVSQGMIDSFWLQGMQAGHKNTFDCIKAFSETDFTEDLKKFDVPTLIIHGDDDQIVPIGAAALRSSKLIRRDPRGRKEPEPVGCYLPILAVNTGLILGLNILKKKA